MTADTVAFEGANDVTFWVFAELATCFQELSDQPSKYRWLVQKCVSEQNFLLHFLSPET
jgi:hypothetical protein